MQIPEELKGPPTEYTYTGSNVGIMEKFIDEHGGGNYSVLYWRVKTKELVVKQKKPLEIKVIKPNDLIYSPSKGLIVFPNDKSDLVSALDLYALEFGSKLQNEEFSRENTQEKPVKRVSAKELRESAPNKVDRFFAIHNENFRELNRLGKSSLHFNYLDKEIIEALIEQEFNVEPKKSIDPRGEEYHDGWIVSWMP